MELKFLAKYPTKQLNNVIYESQVLFYNSLYEKEALYRGNLFITHPPIWHLKLFPNTVVKLRTEFLTNKNSFENSSDFRDYLDLLINYIKDKIDVANYWQAPYIIAKEYNTTHFEFEESNLNNIDDYKSDTNKSIAIMNIHDKYLHEYFNISDEKEYKRILELRRDLMHFYISKALKPFFIELLKHRGRVSDLEYANKADAEVLFFELEYRYRKQKNSKQRFAYLYKFLKEEGMDKKLDFLKSISVYKSKIKLLFNEEITNFNINHMESRSKKSNKSEKEKNTQFETYDKEKEKLKAIYELILKEN